MFKYFIGIMVSQKIKLLIFLDNFIAKSKCIYYHRSVYFAFAAKLLNNTLKKFGLIGLSSTLYSILARNLSIPVPKGL